MNIVIELHEGHLVRNLLENSLLEMLIRDGQNQVNLITPAALSPSFTLRHGRDGARFYDLGLLVPVGMTRWENYDDILGRQLSQRGWHGLRRSFWRWLVEPGVARRAKREIAFLRKYKPDIVVSTHVSQVYGRGLVAAANRMGIPTLGNLNSWDNAWKGLKVRPGQLTCWSENNKLELCRMASYRPEQVRVIGAPAFDAYSAPDGQWTRVELCARLGLDANRPLLLFATLGQFKQQIDETNPLEVLLKAIDAGAISGNPQVVVRLHPWSRETYFKPLLQHPAVTVSRYEHYVPGLTWTPTRDEAILAGNLLRHADVVVSPGSTMSVESAIFDTPVVVPVFNEYMPEIFENYFRQTWLNQHFGRLYSKNWLPVVRSGAEMITAINRALVERNWYMDGRANIRQELLGILDGKATERFAQAILTPL